VFFQKFRESYIFGFNGQEKDKEMQVLTEAITLLITAICT
jgi:hypothetical protein